MKKKTAFYKGLTALVISSMLVTVPAVSHLAYADSDVQTEVTTKENETEAKEENNKTEAKEENNKTEEVKEENTKTEEVKEEDSKTEEVKEDSKTEEVKEESSKTEEVKEDSSKTEEVKEDSAKTDEVKEDDTKTEEAAAEFKANIAKLKAYEEKLESLTSEDAAAINELLDAVSEYLDANEDVELSDDIETLLGTIAEKLKSNSASIMTVGVATTTEAKSINEQIKEGAEKTKTIKVTANIAEDVVIPDGYAITLEIADGATLTNKEGHTITNNGTLTITGFGTVDNVTHGKAAIYNKGKLTIDGGTFERSKEAGTNEPYSGNKNSWYTVYNDYNASLTINDGIFENKGGFSSMLRNQGHLEINDGVFESGVNTIKNDDTGDAFIKGGDFSNTSQAVILNWHNLTITDGTFTAGSGAEYAVMNSSWYESEYKAINQKDYYSNGKLIIEGGEFTGKIGEYVFADKNEANNKEEKNIIVRSGDLTNVPVIEAGERTNLEISDDAVLSDVVVIEVSKAAKGLKLPTNVAKDKDGNYSYTFLGWFNQYGNTPEKPGDLIGGDTTYKYTPNYLSSKIESTDSSADTAESKDTTTSTLDDNAKKVISSILGGEVESGDSKVKYEDLTENEDVAKVLKAALADENASIVTKLELESIDLKDVSPDVFEKFSKVAEEKTASASSTENSWTVATDCFVNIDINMYIAQGDNEKKVARITEVNREVDLSIAIPEELRSKNNKYAVVRYHGDKAEILDATKSADGNSVIFKSNLFSYYGLIYQEVKTADNSSTASRSSGNRSIETTASTGTSNGTWMQDATGWWFKKADGSYPKDTWYECVWNGVSNWYHFNAQGYADGGWLTDKDGQKYYLHNAHDGKFGFMYTGWNKIADQWYYFNTSNIATGIGVGSHSKGSLVTNGTTADGYKVGADGAWIK